MENHTPVNGCYCAECRDFFNRSNVQDGKVRVVVSGGFDPLHVGHVRNFREAKELGDELIVILQTDEHLIEKKGYVFMPFSERKEIVESVRWVNRVVPNVEGVNDLTSAKTLELIKPDVFAKGGDRTLGNLPECEVEVCKRLGIKIVYGVGGNKIQSSSWLVDKVRKAVSEGV